jgi:hypothetical protein
MRTLVKNATNNWEAMTSFNFEFFRDLYEDLQSPVLDNEEEGCQFFAWNFKEFKNLQVMYNWVIFVMKWYFVNKNVLTYCEKKMF